MHFVKCLTTGDLVLYKEFNLTFNFRIFRKRNKTFIKKTIWLIYAKLRTNIMQMLLQYRFEKVGKERISTSYFKLVLFY